jgi:hypothetical protein
MKTPKKKINNTNSAEDSELNFTDPIEKKRLINDDDDDFDEPLEDLGFDDLGAIDDDDDF